MNSNLVKVKLEYVWIDGFTPWGLRSKIGVHTLPLGDFKYLRETMDHTCLPEWGFDGSSTGQASGGDSDCLLSPVKVIPDAVRGDNTAFIVLCEVLNGDGSPHKTNYRRLLSQVAADTSDSDPWFGLEQEYTICKDKRPLGFPPTGYPSPQGIYYCSAGGDRAFGREVSDNHLYVCIHAGLDITGTNAEVMPGQWEYQIGGPNVGAVDVSDQIWLSRWLLLKISEKSGMTVTFEPKPMMGDWNGAGCHTNFSTNRMRQPGGLSHIEQACKKLQGRTEAHLSGYGEGIELRLTGEHETCSYEDFRWGIADRTASIRIPRAVANKESGYLEDRRPNANCDPYVVTRLLLETICLNYK